MVRRTLFPFVPAKAGAQGQRTPNVQFELTITQGEDSVRRMKIEAPVNGYDIDVVVQGYPGKSVCHGGLGWSTIVLLRGHGKVALVDVGGFNIRVPLVERLKHRGLTPKDVNDLLLTHAHHDHCINWTLFSHSRIVLGRQEMEWASKVQWGIGPVPELYVEKLQTWNTLHAAEEGEEVLPGITAHTMPGHTPGHFIYLLKGKDYDVIFTGDAAKN